MKHETSDRHDPHLSVLAGGRLAKTIQLERTCTPDRAPALPVSGSAGLEPEQEAMCGLLADVARRLIEASTGHRSELRVVK